jgi:hypothetical protein
MANTYTLINSSTVGSGGVSTFSFSSIPSTYTDLKFVMSARQSTASIAADVTVVFNGASANNSNKYLYGDGTSANSGTNGYTPSLNYISIGVGNNATANTFSNVEMYVPNYAGSNNKSFSVDSVGESNQSTSVFQIMIAGLWSSSSAINQITVAPATAVNFLQYTTFYLYGISKS